MSSASKSIAACRVSSLVLRKSTSLSNARRSLPTQRNRRSPRSMRKCYSRSSACFSSSMRFDASAFVRSLAYTSGWGACSDRV